MNESEEYQVREQWKEWHLTEAGWMAGSYQGPFDDEPTIVARPAGALKTVGVTAHAAPRLGVIYKRVDTWERKGCKRKVKALEKIHTNGYSLTA